MEVSSSLSPRNSHDGKHIHQPKLPSEILVMIVDLLEFDNRSGEVDHNSLHKLCQISRDMCKIAQPRLFQHFVKTQAQLKKSSPPSRFQVEPCNLRAFLRTLIANHDLACSVKKLTLYAWVDERWQSSTRIKVLPPGAQLCHNLRNVIDEFPLHQVMRRKLLHEIWKGNEDAEIALLLLLTTNVKSLEVFLPGAPSLVSPPLNVFHRPFELLGIAQRAKSGASLAANIEEITCLPPSGRISYFPEPSIADLLRLSSLQVLNLAGLRCENYPPGRWSCKRDISGIKRLAIRDSVLPAKFVQEMIATCTSLESFVLTWPVKDYGGNVNMTWNGMYDALESQKSTLRSITINAGNSAVLSSCRDHEGIPSLRDFFALRTLELNDNAILGGWDREIDDYTMLLPPSLETLTISHASHDLFRILEDMLLHAPSTLPNWKLFRVGLLAEIVDAPYDYSGSLFRRIEDLMATAEGVGITWEWIEVVRRNDIAGPRYPNSDEMRLAMVSAWWEDD